MNRKLTFASALVLALSTGPALADDDVGCGLGTMVWAGQTGVPQKILAGTTNGILFNQWLGITFGTLGCNPNEPITTQQTLEEFASANLDQILAEMAAGRGEHLVVMAELQGIPDADRQAYYAMLQSHFDDLVVDADMTGRELLQRISATMAEDSRLSIYSA